MITAKRTVTQIKLTISIPIPALIANGVRVKIQLNRMSGHEGLQYQP